MFELLVPPVPGFIGFAVGRTSVSEAVAEIARRYEEFVESFETREKFVPA
jgi:hypothetical protein